MCLVSHYHYSGPTSYSEMCLVEAELSWRGVMFVDSMLGIHSACADGVMQCWRRSRGSG